MDCFCNFHRRRSQSAIGIATGDRHQLVDVLSAGAKKTRRSAELIISFARLYSICIGCFNSVLYRNLVAYTRWPKCCSQNRKYPKSARIPGQTSVPVSMTLKKGRITQWSAPIGFNINWFIINRVYHTCCICAADVIPTCPAYVIRIYNPHMT